MRKKVVYIFERSV